MSYCKGRFLSEHSFFPTPFLNMCAASPGLAVTKRGLQRLVLTSEFMIERFSIIARLICKGDWEGGI